MHRRCRCFVFTIAVVASLLLAACQTATRTPMTTLQSCGDLRARAARAIPQTELRRALAAGRTDFVGGRLPRCQPDPAASVVSCEWKGGSTCIVHVCDDVECTSIVDTATNMCDCYKGLCVDQLPAPCQ